MSACWWCVCVELQACAVWIADWKPWLVETLLCSCWVESHFKRAGAAGVLSFSGDRGMEKWRHALTMRCAKMCVPGLRGATSSLWTRLSPPESLSHTSSCSPLHPESITHHLYLCAPNSITPPISVSDCKSSQAVPGFTDISGAAVCVYAWKPDYRFELHTIQQGTRVVPYILWWVVRFTCAWVLRCFLKKELQVLDCTTSRAVWIPI